MAKKVLFTSFFQPFHLGAGAVCTSEATSITSKRTKNNFAEDFILDFKREHEVK